MPYSFENYDDKSSTYTAMRRAIGCDRIIKFLGKPVADVDVLDSGCGTGNYTLELVNKYGAQRVHCADYSQAMVDVAQKNVSSISGNLTKEITFSTDDVCNMPAIPSNKFDLVINNQVVHHLRPDNDFNDLKRACKEWFRVLNSGGKISVNYTPSDSQRVGMWWAELISKAMSQWIPRTPTRETFRQALEEAGFQNVHFEPLLDEILYDPELYLNYQNFIDDVKHFARSDSTFNLCTEEELMEAVAKMQMMVDNGTVDEWWARKEAERKEVGQSVFIFADKP